MKKKWEAAERRGSIVKCGEMLIEGGLLESCGTLHVRQYYVFIKRWVPLER